MSGTPRFVCSLETVFLLITSAAYCTLNICLNDYNAYLFGSSLGERDLQVPLFYTCSNFMLSVLVWTPALLCCDTGSDCAPEVRKYTGFLKLESFRRHWYMLIFLSLSISVSTASQNASLASIPLTINQLLKALSIVPMLFLSCIIEKKSYRPAVLVMLGVQLVGAILAAMKSGGDDYTGHGNQLIGYIHVTISVLSSAIRPVLMGYLYSVAPVAETGFSPIVLAWYDALFAASLLLPLTLCLEWDAIWNLYSLGRWPELWGLSLAGSCMAVMYNLVVFLLVQQIASIGYQALAQFNTVVVVGGAALFIDHIHEPTVWAGTVICLAASTGYLYLRYADLKQAERAKEAKLRPPADEEGGGARGGAPPSEATPLKASGGGGMKPVPSIMTLSAQSR